MKEPILNTPPGSHSSGAKELGVIVEDGDDKLPRPPAKGRRVLRILGFLALGLLWIWTCGALHFLAKLPSPIALLAIPALPLALWFRPRWSLAIKSCVAAIMIWMVCVFAFFTKPSNMRKWWEGNRLSLVVRWDGKPEFDPAVKAVGIQRVRQFKWRSREDFVPSWVFQTFYLDKLDKLDLVVEPLGGAKLFAHTMLSFGFGSEKRVVISIEARRQAGERYGLVAGLYKQYELYYQVNSERDAFSLRALEDDSNLYVYPVKASPEFIRHLFLEIVQKVQALGRHPEFYHSLKANCTTELFEHINRVMPEPIDYGAEILFPAKSGELLHRLGWMDTELDYAAAKERFRLADKVREFVEDPDFSVRIRE